MRKMASIQEVSAITPIPERDRIEVCKINGWNVIAEKGLYKVGDRVIYCEIDSFLPKDLVPWMGEKKKPKQLNGVDGFILKTARMGGVLSQGLLLPVSNLMPHDEQSAEVGDDVSALLGIQQWQDEEKFERGDLKGPYPHFVPKTEQVRIQNASELLVPGEVFEVTEKLEGASLTVHYHNGDVGVSSRNYELRVGDTTQWRTVTDAGYVKALIALKRNIAVQGELIGPGCGPKNDYYGVKKHQFRVYNVYLIDEGRFANPQERFDILGELINEGANVQIAPVVSLYTIADGETVDSILAYAEGKSLLTKTKLREGLVFKRTDGAVSFKAISNEYLLG